MTQKLGGSIISLVWVKGCEVLCVCVEVQEDGHEFKNLDLVTTSSIVVLFTICHAS